MDLSAVDPQKRGEQLLKRIDEIHDRLRKANPKTLVSNTGIRYEQSENGGIFNFKFLQQSLTLHFPDLKLSQTDHDKPINPLIQALVCYYFFTADGTALNQRWISFSELPHGMFYNQAFQSYTGYSIAQKYQNDVSLFSDIAKQLGGTRESFGDIAYRFQLFPRLPLMISGWLGDDEFPPSFKILFDASASHYLPTDGCAIAGSILTGMFLKNKP